MFKITKPRSKPHYFRVECVAGGGQFVFGDRYWAVVRPLEAPDLHHTEIVMDGNPDTTRVVPCWRFKPVYPRNWKLFSTFQRLRFGPESYDHQEAA